MSVFWCVRFLRWLEARFISPQSEIHSVNDVCSGSGCVENVYNVRSFGLGEE